MIELIFLTGDLCNRAFREKARLPLVPISFAICEGTMLRSKYGTLHIPASTKRVWGNKVVYGMLFEVHYAEHYLQIINSIEMAYVNGKRRNKYDIRVAEKVKITPIKFSSLLQLQRLRYEELPKISATTYFANTENKRVRSLLNDMSHCVRIQSGISSSLYMELLNNFK